MTIKATKGQLALPADDIAAVAAELPLFGIMLLQITLADIVALEALPPLHRDPFDRLLVAQASVKQFALVSDDPQTHRYDIATLWE